MVSGSMYAQEEWLNNNAVCCPIGRITQRHCEMLRSRQSPAEWLRDECKSRVHPNRIGNGVRFRPTLCTDCPGWDHWAGGKETTAVENTKSERAAVKRCSKCGEEKPVDHFYKKLAAPDGLQAQCRVCLDMYRKKRRERLELAANTPQSRGGGASSDPAETRRQAGDASAPTQKAERETLFLTIDFTGHRSLLDRITSIAEIEDRTPEMQARYFLRTCLGREYEQ